MALVLIKEDGTGKVDANSYATAVEGDAYHDGHLYATAWTAASTGSKEKALVMATRLIDAQYRFNGFKRLNTQALQWPRRECPDPDRDPSPFPHVLAGIWSDDGFLPFDAVPKALPDATCELARELLIADRTLPAPGEGLKYFNSGTTITGYDKKDRPPLITKVVAALLDKYGAQAGGSGSVRLVRT